jgi:hypothetical protein
MLGCKCFVMFKVLHSGEDSDSTLLSYDIIKYGRWYAGSTGKSVFIFMFLQNSGNHLPDYMVS